MMKKMRFIAIVVMAIWIAGCSKKEDNSISDIGGVNDAITQGSWRVSYFWDSGKDETNHFADYQFTFNASGELIAASGSSTVSGTWSSLDDDSILKLVISFASPDDFTDLNDDWHIIEATAKKIRLEDVSGGGGGTDYLTFEKN